MTTPHPDEEALLGIAADGMSAGDREVATHVRSCAQCGAMVEALAQRLPQRFDARSAVPLELIERAAVAFSQDRPAAPAARIESSSRRSSSIRWRLGLAAALAASLIVVVGTRINRSNDSVELDRGVKVTRVLRVRVASLPLRAQPATDSQAIATMKRGDRIEVLEENGDWWKIRGPENVSGWVSRDQLHP